MPEITIITETISMIVIFSDKIMLEKIMPKIEVAEYNKIVFTPPNNFNAMTKNSVAIPVPTNARNDIGIIWSKLMFNGMPKIIIIDNTKIPDTNDVICVILFASILLLTYLEIYINCVE